MDCKFTNVVVRFSCGSGVVFDGSSGKPGCSPGQKHVNRNVGVVVLNEGIPNMSTEGPEGTCVGCSLDTHRFAERYPEQPR